MEFVMLAVFLFALVGSFLFLLKAAEWVGEKIRKRRAGRRSASPSPSGSPVLIITTFRVTPDRPTDPFLEKARAEIKKMTEGA